MNQPDLTEVDRPRRPRRRAERTSRRPWRAVRTTRNGLNALRWPLRLRADGDSGSRRGRNRHRFD